MIGYKENPILLTDETGLNQKTKLAAFSFAFTLSAICNTSVY